MKTQKRRIRNAKTPSVKLSGSWGDPLIEVTLASHNNENTTKLEINFFQWKELRKSVEGIAEIAAERLESRAENVRYNAGLKSCPF